MVPKWTADRLEHAPRQACELAEERLRIGLKGIERSAMVKAIVRRALQGDVLAFSSTASSRGTDTTGT